MLKHSDVCGTVVALPLVLCLLCSRYAVAQARPAVITAKDLQQGQGSELQ